MEISNTEKAKKLCHEHEECLRQLRCGFAHMHSTLHSREIELEQELNLKLQQRLEKLSCIDYYTCDRVKSPQTNAIPDNHGCTKVFGSSGPKLVEDIAHLTCSPVHCNNGFDGDLIVNSDVTLESDRVYCFETLTVLDGATLTVGQGGRLLLYIADQLHVHSGGKIDLSGKGHASGVGPGAGESGDLQSAHPVLDYGEHSLQPRREPSLMELCSPGGGGAGHARCGEDTAPFCTKFGVCLGPSAGGIAYGSDDIPTTNRDHLLPLGSGGGNSGAQSGGAGGGALLIRALTVKNEGSILCNGFPPPNHEHLSGAGGGSGGSIKIVAYGISSPGVISAGGGAGGVVFGEMSSGMSKSDEGAAQIGQPPPVPTAAYNDSVLSESMLPITAGAVRGGKGSEGRVWIVCDGMKVTAAKQHSP